MKKKGRQNLKDFDEVFDSGRASIDFRSGVVTKGLGQVVTLPPLTIPAWIALEIEGLAKLQANSKAAVVRQLLVDAIESKHRRAA